MNDPVDFAIAAALVALIAIVWPLLERAVEAWCRKAKQVKPGRK